MQYAQAHGHTAHTGESMVFKDKPARMDKDVLHNMMKLSLSMALIWMIQQLYSAVDMMVVGQLIGGDATAAIATASDFTNVMSMVAAAIASGAAVYISQLEGAKDLENLRQAIGSAIVLLFIVAAVAVCYGCLFRVNYLHHLNCPPEAMPGASSYLLITSLGLPFVFTYTGIVSIMKAMGHGAHPLLFAVLACVLNIAGDFVLVVGFHMGVIGTAVSTTAAQAVCCLLAWFHLSKMPSLFGKQPLSYFLKIERKTLRRIMRMAIPTLARVFFVQFSFLWLRGQVNGYGLVEAAAYSIWFKMERFFNSIVFGVQEASCNILGQLIGAKRYDQVKPTVRLTILMGLAGTVVPLILFMAIPSGLFRLFTGDPEIIARASQVLRILAVGLFVNAFGNGSKGISIGAGDSKVTFFVGVLDAGARIAVSLLSAHIIRLGADSYYWGMALAPVAPGIMCMAYLYSEKWRYRKRLSET